jgi:hypothetical protein
MREAETVTDAGNCGGFICRFPAQAVVDRQDKESFAATRGPAIGEVEQRGGITAAGDGESNGTGAQIVWNRCECG